MNIGSVIWITLRCDSDYKNPTIRRCATGNRAFEMATVRFHRCHVPAWSRRPVPAARKVKDVIRMTTRCVFEHSQSFRLDC
jgi:hypothetical protein